MDQVRCAAFIALVLAVALTADGPVAADSIINLDRRTCELSDVRLLAEFDGETVAVATRRRVLTVVGIDRDSTGPENLTGSIRSYLFDGTPLEQVIDLEFPFGVVRQSRDDFDLAVSPDRYGLLFRQRVELDDFGEERPANRLFFWLFDRRSGERVAEAQFEGVAGFFTRGDARVLFRDGEFWIARASRVPNGLPLDTLELIRISRGGRVSEPIPLSPSGCFLLKLHDILDRPEPQFVWDGVCAGDDPFFIPNVFTTTLLRDGTPSTPPPPRSFAASSTFLTSASETSVVATSRGIAISGTALTPVDGLSINFQEIGTSGLAHESALSLSGFDEPTYGDGGVASALVWTGQEVIAGWSEIATAPRFIVQRLAPDGTILDELATPGLGETEQFADNTSGELTVSGFHEMFRTARGAISVGSTRMLAVDCN